MAAVLTGLVTATRLPRRAAAQGPTITTANHISVLTRSYDNGRTGANFSEALLTPANVRAQGMVLQCSLKLTGDDPRIEAQPLYVPGLTMSDGQKHDTIFVCSMSNNIWAFDANTGNPIWPHPVNLAPPFIPAPNDGIDSFRINRSFGILSTPVIDIDQGIMYVVYWRVDASTNFNRLFQLSAIRLSDGQEAPGKPTRTISASVVNSIGQTITMNQVQKQRAALLLTPLRGPATAPAHKMLYVAITGSEQPPANGDATTANHGWLIGFDVDNWNLPSDCWCASPRSFGGGIWQASQGPAADADGNVYFMTANGGYTVEPTKTDYNGQSDFGETFCKIACANQPTGPKLSLVDWFSPFRDSQRTVQGELDYTDQDLGSSGPVIPNGSVLIVGAGKDGVMYVLDQNNMGKVVGDLSHLKTPPVFFTFDPDPTIPSYANASPSGNLDFKPGVGVKTHHQHSSPVYWESQAFGPMLFTWGENSTLRAYAFDKVTGVSKLLARGSEVASAGMADPRSPSVGGMPGAMLALSADGNQNGIVWATAPIDLDANKAAVAGIVRAYDATSYDGAAAPAVGHMKLLWENAGFTFSKFCTPVVVDGRLIVPTYDGRVDVYVLGTAN